MSPVEGTKDMEDKYIDKIAKFVSDVRTKKIEGSSNIALATLSMLEQIISDSENATAYELTTLIRGVGRGLSRALPVELVAANVVRRVLRAIRDEHRAHSDQSGAGAGSAGGAEGAGESLQRLVQATSLRRGTMGAAQPDLREPLRDHIAEVRLELESSVSAISSQAAEHVRAEELVLAYCGGRLLLQFLRAARLRARYRLLLPEGAHHEQTHALAAKLAASGVAVAVVSGAAVAALMSRVNKVVLSVSAVLAGGAVLAPAGARALTAAAHHYSVPVIALSPLYKLSPQLAPPSAAAAPHAALPYQMSESSVTHVLAPQHELVPADHVTLFLTNLGGSSPSYIYRLLSELYDPKDHEL